MKRHIFTAEDAALSLEIGVTVPTACAHWYYAERNGNTSAEFCMTCVRRSKGVQHAEYDGLREGDDVITPTGRQGVVSWIFDVGGLVIGGVVYGMSRVPHVYEMCHLTHLTTEGA